MAFGFGGAGGGAADAIADIIKQRLLQQQMDEEVRANKERAELQRQELTERAAERAEARRLQERTQARLDKADAREELNDLVENTAPGSKLNAPAYIALAGSGRGTLITQPKAKLSPEQLAKLPAEQQAEYNARPDTGAMGEYRGSPKHLETVRQEEVRRVDKAQDTATAQAWRDQDREDRQREQAAAREDAAALRREIAGQTNAMRQAAADAKADEKAAKRTAEQRAVDAARSSVHDQATEILNTPDLGKFIGLIDGSKPDALVGEAGRDFRRKVEQLKASLALNERAKLKGQGAISDRETQMLERAVTRLATTGSVEAFKAELNRIIEATKPTGAPSAAAPSRDLGADW